MPAKDRGFTLIELLIAFVILGILGMIVLFALGYGENDEFPPNTDPQFGWVQVEDSLQKRCDGSTMLYRRYVNGPVTASPRHEECAPR